MCVSIASRLAGGIGWMNEDRVMVGWWLFVLKRLLRVSRVKASVDVCTVARGLVGECTDIWFRILD